MKEYSEDKERPEQIFYFTRFENKDEKSRDKNNYYFIVPKK